MWPPQTGPGWRAQTPAPHLQRWWTCWSRPRGAPCTAPALQHQGRQRAVAQRRDAEQRGGQRTAGPPGGCWVGRTQPAPHSLPSSLTCHLHWLEEELAPLCVLALAAPQLRPEGGGVVKVAPASENNAPLRQALHSSRRRCFERQRQQRATRRPTTQQQAPLPAGAPVGHAGLGQRGLHIGRRQRLAGRCVANANPGLHRAQGGR